MKIRSVLATFTRETGWQSPGSQKAMKIRSILVTALLCSGCGSSLPQDPHQALLQYLAAISANDPEKAFTLLDDKLQKRISLTEFKSNWKLYQAELQAQAKALKQQVEKPVAFRAALRLPENEEVRLIRRDQGWQLENGLGIFLQTDTPQAILRTLARAVEDLNFQTIYMLLAEERRQAVQEEMKKRLELLPSAQEKIEVKGNRARVEFGPSYSIELIKEGGQWRILTIN